MDAEAVNQRREALVKYFHGGMDRGVLSKYKQLNLSYSKCGHTHYARATVLEAPSGNYTFIQVLQPSRLEFLRKLV